MRRLEYLITEVRNSTDNKDVNGVSTPEIVGYFNAAQRYIETLIFKNNPYADVFKERIEIAGNSTGIFDIPANCYSINSISLIEGRFGGDTSNNNGYSRIKPISESEFSYMFGYKIQNGKVYISGQNSVAQMDSLRITYFKKLPTLDVRQAGITTVTPGVSILMNTTPTDLYAMSDAVSTVDIYGDQVVSGIYYTNTSGATLLTSTTTGVTTSQYVVSGSDACNKSQLPDSCETYLLDYVRQRIYTRNNYEDAQKQMFFTEQQKSEVIAIFSKNKKDEDSIPITDTQFLQF
jgi:hypothetical protein